MGETHQLRHGLAPPRVGQGGGGADEQLLRVEALDAARLDGPGLAALRRALLPDEGSDERLAPQDPLLLVALGRTLVLRHVAVRVRRYRPDQRLRGLKRRSDLS